MVNRFVSCCGSVMFALLFLFGFNATIVYTAINNWDSSCDAPLGVFLVCFGLVGLVRRVPQTARLRDPVRPASPSLQMGAILYFVLEVALPDALIVNTLGERSTARSDQVKLLVLVLLLAATASGAWGTVLFAMSPTCGTSAPVLYKWSFAASLAFCIFVGLVLLVPLLSLLMPIFAMALAPLIGALVACATWMHEARHTH